MPLLKSFNPVDDRIPEWPLQHLPDFADRAMRLLPPLEHQDLQAVAEQMWVAIIDTRSIDFEIRMDRCVRRLVEHGGWELKYYPDGEPVTEAGVRSMLANWPEDAEEESPVPWFDDLSDADCLATSIEDGRVGTLLRDGAADEVLAEHIQTSRLYALLCLLKVEESLETLGWTESHRWMDPELVHSSRMTWAASAALEAADALAFALLARQSAGTRAVALDEARRMQSSAAPPRVPRRPPAEKGGEGKGATYAAMKAYVIAKRREAISTGAYQEDQFILEMQEKLGPLFPYRHSGKRHKRGDPRPVARSTLVDWIKDA